VSIHCDQFCEEEQGLRYQGVRSAFVPNFQLAWSGSTAFRSVFPASLVESIPDLPPDSTHWWGPTTSFFASRLGKNTYTVVGGVWEDPKNPSTLIKDVNWDEEASVQLLRDGYKDWHPVVKTLADKTPDLRFYPNLSCSEALDSWVFGDRITLIGDAAHAHGGAHATGGSLAIDDAYTLYLSLLTVFPLDSTVKPIGEGIGKALRLYEATRKPHAEKLLKKVHTANAAKLRKIRSGALETDEELRLRASKGSDTTWLHEHDVVKAFEDTLRGEDESLTESSVEFVAKL
jgi:salicylate hydroxylase